MEHLQLEVRKREESGTRVCRRIRRAGLVPAVVYGLEQEPLPVEVSEGDIGSARRAGGEHLVIDLKISEGDGAERTVPVIIRDEQFHPVRGKLLHVDFYRVSMTRKITSEVPVETTGEPAGINFGGILEHAIRDVEVECFPDSLPENIEIDVSDLNIGDSLTVGDLRTPEGVEILTDPEQIVVSVMPPAAEEEEEEAAEEEEEAAEPEVITEKKKEEEPEEGGEKE